MLVIEPHKSNTLQLFIYVIPPARVFIPISPASSLLRLLRGEKLSQALKLKIKHHPSWMADEPTGVSVAFCDSTQQPAVGR